MHTSTCVPYLGVPYPARFELPTLWSESTFKLSWRVNSTLPIISYRLEFRKVPYGEWVTINVPSDTNTQREADVRSDPATHLLKGKKGVVTGAAHKEVIYIQSYTLKGLRKDTSYEVLRAIKMDQNCSEDKISLLQSNHVRAFAYSPQDKSDTLLSTSSRTL